MTEEKKVMESNAISLDLSEIARTPIWVDGDCTKVIRLNLTDMGIINRLHNAYPKLDELTAEVQKMSASADISDDEIVETFNKINQQMKDLVDSIFDFPVSDMLCYGGSMYDPINGQLRFEYIIERLSKLYETSIGEEVKRMQAKTETHTSKYTKSRKRK